MQRWVELNAQELQAPGRSQDAREVLHSGYPIVSGISLHSSFMDQATADSGIVPFPAVGESIEGGHDVSLVKYDRATVMNGRRGWLKFQNHWGSTDWGCAGGPHNELGFFWMHEDLLTRSQLDLVVVHYGHGW